MTELKRRIGRSTNPATIEWCTERDHPVTTYNPWLDLSLCRCGEIQVDGDAPMTEAGWLALNGTGSRRASGIAQLIHNDAKEA